MSRCRDGTKSCGRLDSISGWNWPGFEALFSTIEVFTAAWFGAIIGAASITYLFIKGQSRLAIGLTVAGAIVGAFAVRKGAPGIGSNG